MTWRNQNTHREESKAVKDALVKAGYTNVKVGHGTGTAWSWLKIHCERKPDQTFDQSYMHIIGIAQGVTGRHGDYNGQINVYIQHVS